MAWRAGGDGAGGSGEAVATRSCSNSAVCHGADLLDSTDKGVGQGEELAAKNRINVEVLRAQEG